MHKDKYQGVMPLLVFRPKTEYSRVQPIERGEGRVNEEAFSGTWMMERKMGSCSNLPGTCHMQTARM